MLFLIGLVIKMLPENQITELLEDYETKVHTTETFKLNTDENRVYGITDGIDAIKQAAYKILNTERYKYGMYSWGYGIELEDLFGMDIDLVIAKLPNRIKEALTQDDRIIDVTDFEFKKGRNELTVNFVIDTNIGKIEAEKVVSV